MVTTQVFSRLKYQFSISIEHRGGLEGLRREGQNVKNNSLPRSQHKNKYNLRRIRSFEEALYSEISIDTNNYTIEDKADFQPEQL